MADMQPVLGQGCGSACALSITGFIESTGDWLAPITNADIDQ